MKNTTTKKAKSTAPKAKPTETGKIVHRLPGRVRVKIDRLHNDIKYGNDLKQAVTALHGVTEVRINPLASSIVISYYSSELSEQKVLDCLSVSFPTPEVAKPSEHPVKDESAADFVEEVEEFTAEITSEIACESIGEVVGETIGEILMGPIGMAIGAEIGAKIGGEIGESILETKGSANEHLAAESIDRANQPQPSKLLTPPPKRNNNRQNNQGGK